VKEVGFRDDPNLALLLSVLEALGDIRESLVLVGGCATGLLLTAPRAELIRATRDVDVVAELVSLSDYHELEAAVSRRGFRHDLSPEAPICRWIRDGTRLDLVPSRPEILGFSNSWYPLAVDLAERVKLPGGLAMRLIPASVFVAAKLEAFWGRGEGDFLASHDLEDILTVVDGRSELADELANAPVRLRAYTGRQFSKLLEQPAFLESLPGHLPADPASQARLPDLLDRIRAIAALGKR